MGDVDYLHPDLEGIQTYEDGLVYEKNVVYSSPHATDDIECQKRDDCLIPSTITIDVGETVHWKHYAPGSWITTGGRGEPSFGFEEPRVRLGYGSVTFDEEGVYEYYFQVMPFVRGKIIVGNPPAITIDDIKIPEKFKDVVLGLHYKERPISDFFFVVRYLDDKGIITVENTGSKTIPSWFETTAFWWSEGKVSDKEFIHAMKYLAEKKMLTI